MTPTESNHKIDYDMLALQSGIFTTFIGTTYIAQDYASRGAGHLPEGPFLVESISNNIVPAVIMGVGMAASRVVHHHLKKHGHPVLAGVALVTGLVATSAGAACITMMTHRPAAPNPAEPKVKTEQVTHRLYNDNSQLTALPPKTIAYSEALKLAI